MSNYNDTLYAQMNYSSSGASSALKNILENLSEQTSKDQLPLPIVENNELLPTAEYLKRLKKTD